ncbi:hypothetical protein [Mucilaginibacter gotjawali]|uniref:Uncharacterized protein n=2 Tax=Mucilaginibacter gotjawali TaxID=1550579 RepID=A0A120MYC7_9SPHI|nr:hypothetical protein [Mucilaginibacter gotjawali]MBB3059070.1 hypothetical protein [Mucilaginibacter gotjawali]BAU52857.1 hypothetical protein MgSA37_01021 [Mucilaginibacter gotjawali]
MKKKLNKATKYLMKSKVNKKRLLYAIDEMKKGIYYKHDLIEN